MNVMISWGQMEQLVAIVAVCRLAILKRMPAPPLTLFQSIKKTTHRVQEQVAVQIQRSGKMKTWGGSRTQRANILNSPTVFCRKLAFVTSDNPAAAGRFMEEDFMAKRHDVTTIKNNMDDLSKLKGKIDELNAKVIADDNALFDSNGRHLDKNLVMMQIKNLLRAWNRSKRLSAKPWSSWRRLERKSRQFSQWNRETR